MTADARPGYRWPVFVVVLLAGSFIGGVAADALRLFEWKARVGGVLVAPMVFALFPLTTTAVAMWLSARRAPPA